ncbi:MAG: MFS transporter [Pyrobaculum sp.]
MNYVNLATFFFFTANGIAIVALPPYLRDLGVASETVIGAVISTAFFISIVVRPLGGFLGEKIGYLEAMRLGAAFAVMAQVMYLLGDVRWVQVGRVFHGLAIAVFLPMSVAASVTEGTRSMASRSLAVGMGNVVGPLAGSTTYDIGGATSSLATALMLHGVNLALVFNSPPLAKREEAGSGGVERRVYLYMGFLTLYSAVYTSLSTFIPVHLKDLTLPIAYWGLFSATAASISLLPRAALLRRGTVNTLIAGGATAGAMVGLTLVTFAKSPLDFATAGVIYGMGQGAVVVTYQILALAGHKRAGVASAIYTTGWDLGAIAGPLMAGRLVESVGYDALHYLPSLLLINTALLFFMYLTERRGVS